MQDKKNDRFKSYKSLIIVIFVATLLLSIGYAQISSRELSIEGTAKAYEQEGVYVSGVSYISGSYVNTEESYTNQRVGATVNSKIVLEENQNATATYQITATNQTDKPYIYVGPSVSENFYSNSNIIYTVTGINIGDIVQSGQNVTFSLTYAYDAGVNPSTIPNELDAYINFGFRQIYPITYVRIDGSGYPSYVTKWKPSDNQTSNLNVDFGSNAPEELIITGVDTGTVYNKGTDFTYTNGVLSFSNVTEPLTVAAPVPNEPPVLTNLLAEQQSTLGSVKLTFAATDDNGLDHYDIETYRVVSGVDTLISTDTVAETETEFTKTGLVEDETYYFKVKVYDIYGLTAEQSTAATPYRWNYTATINITNGGPNGTTNITYGNQYSVTLTVNNGYYSISNMTVTMGGTGLSNTEYSYDANNGSFSIPKITGDISITGNASQNFCLIEGTKVKLANGEEKNIEDIDYDDLLLVWSYDEGRVVEEYPLWIEQEKTATNYTKITFSDNSSINIHYDHAFFSSDDNKFVNVQDKESFHIGTHILKVNDKNNLQEVSVTKIENIEQEVKYYFVASTRYYNIISDNFITTDAYTDITNLYPFNQNITWSRDRKIKTLDYKYLEDVLPYYMYKGFRAGEVAILLNNNQTNMIEFKDYIENSVLSETMLKRPTEKNGNRYWTVSTDSKWNNKTLVKEGDYYKLPFGNTKKWYSTSENKYYYPGEKVRVWTGMHFESMK